MYKLSVPIMLFTVNERTRRVYAEQCRRAGVERIFLAIGTIFPKLPEHLEESIAYFKDQGFEVGVWVDTIGHGVVLSHVEGAEDLPQFSPMVDITGEVRPYTNCPLDEAFRTYISKKIGEIAALGADIVQLDDDFRMSLHGNELCCACPLHLKRIGEILGEEVTVETIRPYLLSGKANRYRDAWLTVQNEGLVELAKRIRSEVDKKSPRTRVCFCVAPCHWNVDGADIEGITRILAGEGAPLVRLSGAPYWAFKSRRYSLCGVLEVARMAAAFFEGKGIETMAEGDVYPRPRYTCPASYLELYDSAIRVDGVYSGILKYMFDYVAGPEFETGYLDMHEDSKPFFEKIPIFFPRGANAGVRVYVKPYTYGQADQDLSELELRSPIPKDGLMMSACGIPTVYRGEGICTSVFGENAREMDLSILKNGVLLDAVSAVLLTERGVDVGLDSFGTMEDKTISFLCTQDEEYKSLITNGEVRLLKATLKQGVVPLLFSAEGRERKEPVAYCYENKAGQRFLVFLYDGALQISSKTTAPSGLLQNYATQKVLAERIPWIARQPLPASCVGNPNLYLMCEKHEDSMSVALFNCFADPVLQPKILLDESYSKIECVDCEATLEGNRVTLKSKLYGYTSAMFRVYR